MNRLKGLNEWKKMKQEFQRKQVSQGQYAEDHTNIGIANSNTYGDTLCGSKTPKPNILPKSDLEISNSRIKIKSRDMSRLGECFGRFEFKLHDRTLKR